MYDSAYQVIVAVHHMKPGTQVTLERLLGTDALKKAAGQAFYGGGYRYAGTVILDDEECCPDRALEIAWQTRLGGKDSALPCRVTSSPWGVRSTRARRWALPYHA